MKFDCGLVLLWYIVACLNQIKKLITKYIVIFFICVPFLNQRANCGEVDLSVFMKDEQFHVL